jgi:AmmeMemoRadiSam system protein A
MASGSPQLSDVHGRFLVEAARHAIREKLRLKGEAVAQDPAPAACDPCLQACNGIFVTLKIGKSLRGCIGCLVGNEPLTEAVRTYALHAAFDDPRFAPVTEKELDKVSIEVSVLTQPQALVFKDADDLVSKLRPHVDGVTLRKGGNCATFLPQVWEQLPLPQDFLSNLCLKAGLPSDAWRAGAIEVETYQVQYFEED